MVTDIFTPGLTAGNPLALPALNHSIVSSGARFMLASTLHYGAPGPVDLASIAHVLGTLSIPRIYYAPTRIASLPPRIVRRRKPCTKLRLPRRLPTAALRLTHSLTHSLSLSLSSFLSLFLSPRKFFASARNSRFRAFLERFDSSWTRGDRLRLNGRE